MIQTTYRWARRERLLDDQAAGGLVTNLDGWYPPVPPGLAQCARCAALLVDAAEPRRVHDRFHDGLRLLWDVPAAPGTTRSMRAAATRRHGGRLP